MEAIALHDIEETELRSLLYNFPEIWKKNSGFFDSGLTQVYGNFGETENLVFGVHIFTHGNGAVLFIILIEYLRDSRVASFNINARSITGLFSPSIHKKGEIKIREILEKLTYEDLEKFAIVGQHLEDDSIFICPRCKAQYLMRVLRVATDGKTECQNCNGLFSPEEIEIARKAASYDS